MPVEYRRRPSWPNIHSVAVPWPCSRERDDMEGAWQKKKANKGKKKKNTASLCLR
jgi:hypothetical protein